MQSSLHPSDRVLATRGSPYTVIQDDGVRAGLCPQRSLPTCHEYRSINGGSAVGAARGRTTCRDRRDLTDRRLVVDRGGQRQRYRSSRRRPEKTKRGSGRYRIRVRVHCATLRVARPRRQMARPGDARSTVPPPQARSCLYAAFRRSTSTCS